MAKVTHKIKLPHLLSRKYTALPLDPPQEKTRDPIMFLGTAVTEEVFRNEKPSQRVWLFPHLEHF